MTGRSAKRSPRLAVALGLCAAIALSVASTARSQTAIATWLGDPAGEGYGVSIRPAGDVDDDGHPDVFVYGANPGGQGPNPYLRVVSGADASVLHDFEDPGASNFARTFAAAGDVDDDGCDDMLIGDPLFDDPNDATVLGKLFVLSGKDASEIFVLVGSDLLEFADDVAGVGDLDGDGHDDFAVGAPFVQPFFGGHPNDRAFVYSGADASLMYEFKPSDAIIGPQPASLGTDVGAAGDVDADGVPDVFVGASGNCENTTTTFVRVYSGGDGSLVHQFTGSCGGFGFSFADAGDVDADGHDDVLLGDDLIIGFGWGPGEVRVHSGADASPLYDYPGTDELRLGITLAGIGDVDHDGHDDFAAGAPNFSEGAGFVRAWSGRDGAELFTLSDDVVDAGYGSAVAAVGDLDLDGYDDFAAGIALDDAAAPDAGKVVVFSGYFPWSDVGQGLAGSQGVPTLAVSGRQVAGFPILNDVAAGPAGGTAWLVMGLGLLGAPFKGGVMVPTVDLVVGGLPLDGSGALQFSYPWPAGVPPLLLLSMQMWFPDPAGVFGFSASNAVVGATR